MKRWAYAAKQRRWSAKRNPKNPKNPTSSKYARKPGPTSYFSINPGRATPVARLERYLDELALWHVQQAAQT